MDGRSFDRLTRWLGGDVTRRQGLRATIGAAIGLIASAPAVADAAKRGEGSRDGGKDRPGRKGRGKPSIEGPCGNGSRKDNACTKNRDCCTGLCNMHRAKKNVDGKGRCRCAKSGRPCKEQRNCCGGHECVEGVCGGKPAPGPGPNPDVPVPTGEACIEGKSTCADTRAACIGYDRGSQRGTYCLLPFQAECTGDAECKNGTCSLGICVNCSCAGCPTGTCEPDVCASGCDYDTVQAAIDAAASGDVIHIAPGTYSEDLSISGKHLALVGCPGGEVILRNATVGERTIDVSDSSRLELVDIVIEGNNNDLDTYGGGVATLGDLTLCRFTVVRGNRAPDSYGGGIRVSESVSAPVLRVLDGSVIEGNRGGYGGGIGMQKYSTVIVDDEAVIRNNKADTYGGGIYLDPNARAVIRGNAQLTGNTSDSYGGAFMYYGGAYSGTVLDLSGNVLIDDNEAAYGGGLGIYNCDDEGDEKVIIRGNVTISNNTASDQGGGLWNDNCRFTITDSVKITGNTAASEGGGIYFGDRLDDSYGLQLDISGDVEISGNHSDSYGGGLYLDSAMTRIGGRVKFTDNTSVKAGGAISASEATITIQQSVAITGNTSDSYGGAIYATYNKLTIIGNTEISGNSAGLGGAIALWRTEDSYATYIGGDVKIVGNTARAVGSFTGQGGAFYLDGSDLELAGNADVSGNTAAAEGGGVALMVDTIGGSNDKSNLTISGNAKISVNTSSVANGGGGVWAEDTASIVTAPAGSITGNTPDQCVGSSSADCTA